MAEPQFTPEELENEEWRPVVEFPDAYSVSNLGHIRRDKAGKGTRSGKILHPAIAKKSQCRLVALSIDGVHHYRYVHHLVALAFIGPRPEGQEINHDDGSRANNRVTNLEWMTHPDNMKHGWRTGLIHGVPGELRASSLMTPKLVIAMRGALANNLSQRRIARMYAVSRGVVQGVKRGSLWSHV